METRQENAVLGLQGEDKKDGQSDYNISQFLAYDAPEKSFWEYTYDRANAHWNRQQERPSSKQLSCEIVRTLINIGIIDPTDWRRAVEAVDERIMTCKLREV